MFLFWSRSTFSASNWFKGTGMPFRIPNNVRR